MSNELLTKVDKDNNNKEVPLGSEPVSVPPPITANDPSFNIRFEPHEIPSKTETFKTNLKEKFEETSTAISNSVDFSMGGLIKQALSSFENFTDPKLEQRIPFDQLGDIKGIMFLSVVKGGFGIGGLIGTGIIMSRNPTWKYEWSSPSAIGLGGLQIGLNVGIQKSDHIIFIRDEDVITKFRNGINLGSDISLCVGNLGRDANLGRVSVNQKGVINNISYSMSKGIYLGFALEGAIITIRNDCNETFFGQKCDISQILNGSVRGPFNEDYNRLCEELSKNLISSSSSSNTTNLSKDENHPILNITSSPKHA